MIAIRVIARRPKADEAIPARFACVAEIASLAMTLD
jgi:hypothetical protein